MNAGLKALHQQLIKDHQVLAKRLGTETDLDAAEATLREMEELNFRVMVTGRLLFKETTAGIDAQIETVVAATADLEKSIKQITKIRELVKTISGVLSLVDKVLDKVKLL